MFDIQQLFIVIFGTLAIFSWLLIKHEIRVRIFFSLFLVMYLIYSGIGAALDTVDERYIYYYFAFTIAINIGIYWGLKTNRRNNNLSLRSWNIFLDLFIDKYAKWIIYAYLFLNLMPLIIPENRLYLLINPPIPNALAMLQERFQVEHVQTFFTSLMTAVKSILYPFYLLSLYKYRDKLVKLTLCVILPYYLEYCSNAYIGRGSMLEAIFIIAVFVFLERPQWRKRIVIGAVVFFPFIMFAFLQYSFIRGGESVVSVRYSEAISIIFQQEFSYPEWFGQILEIDDNYIYRYLVWLLTIPFPGIVRGGLDVHFAAIFSEHMIGIFRGEKNFYIVLPGVVGESVFLFGKQLFWINGVIYGFVMGFFFRILSRRKQFLALFVVAIFDFGYVTNRAGMFGSMPFFLKILPYFFIILWYVKNRMKNQILKLLHE